MTACHRNGSAVMLLSAVGLCLVGIALTSDETASTGTCPAGSNSPECRAPNAGNAEPATPSEPSGLSGTVAAAKLRVDRVALAGAAKPHASADLITQEIHQLGEYIQLCEGRIKLLEDLENIVGSGHNISLPESHMRALKEKLPLMSVVSVDIETSPIGAAEDYYVTKAVLAQDDAAAMLKFMPLRSPAFASGGSSGSNPAAQTVLPSALLVTAATDGVIKIFTPSGELVHTFVAGHEQPVMLLSISQSVEEHVIATADVGGVVRLHKVSVKQRRHAKERQERRGETKVSQYLASQVNVTSQFERQLSAPTSSDTEPAKLTALTIATQSGSRYVVVGDEKGSLSIFSKNGTLKRKVAGTNTPDVGIEGLHAHLGSLIFWAGTEFGYLDLDKGEARHMDCAGFEGRVVTAIVDSQTSARILVAGEGGRIAVLNARNKKECRVEHRFAKGTSAPAVVGLGSTKGFAFVLEQSEASWSLAALNMSHVGKMRHDVAQAPSPVVWRLHRPSVRAWAFHRRAQQGDLIAILSEDGKEIEIAEILMSMYTPPVEDNFSNYKFPMVAVGIVLVLGYQYMKMNRGSSGGGGGGGASSLKDKDFEKELKALREKKRLAKAKEKAEPANIDMDD